MVLRKFLWKFLLRTSDTTLYLFDQRKKIIRYELKLTAESWIQERVSNTFAWRIKLCVRLKLEKN